MSDKRAQSPSVFQGIKDRKVVERIMGEATNPALGDELEAAMSGALARASERSRPLLERKLAAHGQRQRARARVQETEQEADDAAAKAAAELQAQAEREELNRLADSLSPEQREHLFNRLVQHGEYDEKAIEENAIEHWEPEEAESDDTSWSGFWGPYQADGVGGIDQR